MHPKKCNAQSIFEAPCSEQKYRHLPWIAELLGGVTGKNPANQS